MKKLISLSLILLCCMVTVARPTPVTIKASNVDVTTVAGGNVDNAMLVHQDNTATHGATEANTANRIVLRDASGRAQVASPSVDNDIATKEYADSLVAVLLPIYANLKITTTGAADNQSVVITADKIVIVDSSNSPAIRNNISVAVAIDNSGANGLDNGSLAASTGYFLYVIDNGATTAGLASTSATAPVMPSGYTYKALVGWCTTDNTTTPFNIEEFTQIDDEYLWTALQRIVNDGAAATTTKADLSPVGTLGYSVAPPSITKGVYGVVMHNDANTAHIHPVTFGNTPAVGDTTISFHGTAPGTSGSFYLPNLQESQAFYWNFRNATSDLWISGFTLKR